VALTVGLGAFPTWSQAQTSTPTPRRSPTRPLSTLQQNVPAEYQSAIRQLRVAKAYLEKAGDKWGGYRVKGFASIDQAFRALGVSAESTPGEMQSGNVDEPSMMNNGMSGLQSARAAFAGAASNWGGRRERAVARIDQALKDLQAGIEWAKQHNTY
jgi:hypothetical protein